MNPPEELRLLAAILADWAATARGAQIYLYGSRVRGDHRPDSDVDIAVQWGRVSEAERSWWSENNWDLFEKIGARLPGKLEVLEFGDPLRSQIFAAPVVYRDRNVICVMMPPKSESVKDYARQPAS